MNAGQPVMVSAKRYRDKPALSEWLKFLAENYGSTAMSVKGAISGFPAAALPSNLPATTSLVTTQIKATKTPLGWFESLLSAKAKSVSEKNAAGLVNGSVPPARFMEMVQAALNG